MRSIAAITLLAFVTGLEPAAIHSGDAQIFSDKLADKLCDRVLDSIDRLADKLSVRRLNGSELHYAGLQNTALGKPGSVAMPSRSSLRSIANPPLPWNGYSTKIWPWTGSRPQFS